MPLRALAIIGGLAMCAGAWWILRNDPDHVRALDWGRSFRRRFGARVAYLTVGLGLALVLWVALALGDDPAVNGQYTFQVEIGALVILLFLDIAAYIRAVWRGE